MIDIDQMSVCYIVLSLPSFCALETNHCEAIIDGNDHDCCFSLY